MGSCNDCSLFCIDACSCPTMHAMKSLLQVAIGHDQVLIMSLTNAIWDFPS